MIESFWSTMQRELLDPRTWATPQPSSPRRSSSGSKAGTTPADGTPALGYLSPVEYEALHNAAATAA